MSLRFNRLKRLTSFSVSIPTDEEGFVGRECPIDGCEGYFKVKPGTGLTGADLPCVCPYCGHSVSNDTFFTKDQLEFARSYGIRKVTEAVREDLKSMEFKTRPSGPLGLSISMTLKPGQLPRLRHYREKSLETKVTCDSCTLDYSVFGVFGYCPDCGEHNSLLILKKNLLLIDRALELAEGLEDSELRTHLIEDALENCVSSFDGFAREACSIRKSKSTDERKCSKLSFQNLRRVASEISTLFGIDISSKIPPSDWKILHVRFMQRHLLAHKAGVIDEKFIAEVGTDYGPIGRKVVLSVDDVRHIMPIISSVGESLVIQLPS